ncbi:uncharacterized protein VICG_00421 [Vittaforma corneae ATCC 50505]|uniref:Uncharacterized protein n=1 Tax=Vittaforma corneae (strain ATCC 50505) TaxID=993615 RepID=L2GPZ7_VITCO|nr:uncharacterized protein VICG_00421 [Vittaforma corneae ATCC 50505]ELA42669.1 hypothetical protein VICG_00421 [Vittaforma corneae ATCC 50505]
MVNLKRVLKEYNCKLDLKTITNHGKKTKIDERKEQIVSSLPISDAIVWPRDFLPYTKYLENQTESNLDRIERWRNAPLKLKNKKFVQALTRIDLDLIRALSADDLISFDGHSASKPILHIQNKNKALIAMFSLEFETKRLFKLLKYALIYKNYNLIHLLVRSLQTKKLSQRRLERILYYKKVLENEEGGIFPLAWMLKDCEDSNLNIDSEMASLRFCKIIEKLKEMKNIETDFEVSEKNKQTLYSKLWDIARKNDIDLNISEKRHEYLYLIL